VLQEKPTGLYYHVHNLQAESEEIAARLSIPNTHFDLQYVRPDFVMLRVIARNIVMWSR
jgi:anaphase-promoting complex subunit 1